jgi:hypothetical protein
MATSFVIFSITVRKAGMLDRSGPRELHRTNAGTRDVQLLKTAFSRDIVTVLRKRSREQAFDGCT